MNEQIKLLLMSYIDGDCSEKESMEAEAIIKSDPEALDFTNRLKQANIEIDTFYKSQDNEEMEDRLYQFVEKKILKIKSSESSFLNKIFTLRPALNYSLTALFFLSVGVFYDDFMSSNQELVSQSVYEKPSWLSELNNNVYTKEVLKKRGVEEFSEAKDLISQTISEMIEEKSSEAKLQYGVHSYAIFLDDVYFKKRSGFVCYYGTILNNGLSKKISYCASKTDKALIYIN